ncbi:MAG: flagellar protein FlaG [Defluviitaleaceae bacterium]|nr:flagellar protein FlaG [Defluviitaleaceae bacterium]
MDVNNNNQISATAAATARTAPSPATRPAEGNNRPTNTNSSQAPSTRYDAPSPSLEVAQAALTREAPSRVLDSRIREEDVNDQMLDNAIAEANKAIPNNAFSLSYGVHEPTNRITVSIYSPDTGELIRELPPESRLDTYARISEFVGLLFDKNA